MTELTCEAGAMVPDTLEHLTDLREFGDSLFLVVVVTEASDRVCNSWFFEVL
jgi:hypothetical protein